MKICMAKYLLFYCFLATLISLRCWADTEGVLVWEYQWHSRAQWENDGGVYGKQTADTSIEYFAGGLERYVLGDTILGIWHWNERYIYIPTGLDWMPLTTYTIDFIAARRWSEHIPAFEYGLWAGQQHPETQSLGIQGLFHTSSISTGQWGWLNEYIGRHENDVRFEFTTGVTVTQEPMYFFIRNAGGHDNYGWVANMRIYASEVSMPKQVAIYPAGQVTVAEHDVEFRAKADIIQGENLTYQWYCVVDSELNVMIPGANSDTLLIENVRRDDSGRYYCHITFEFEDSIWEIYSQTASLEVISQRLLDDFNTYGVTNPVESAWVPNDHAAVELSALYIYEGFQSLALTYNNTAGSKYAQICHEFDTPEDWSDPDFDGFVLYFRGQLDNAIEPFYLILQDTSGKRSIQQFPRAADLANPSWQAWPISLKDISDDGLNVASICKIALRIGCAETPRLLAGSGKIWLDNIRLSSFLCKHPGNLALTLSENCQLKLASLSILADHWLMDCSSLPGGCIGQSPKVDFIEFAFWATSWYQSPLTYRHGVVYYVNSDAGDDANSGINPTTAWKSLQKVNDMAFKPGDRILFKAGTSYRGSLIPKGSGVQGRPIEINKYGTGDKPVIHAAGYEAAVRLHNIEYWQINNLALTNDGGDPIEPQAETRRYGVLVTAEDIGTLYHIYLRDLHIHNIFPTIPNQGGWGREGTGVSIDPVSNEVRTVFKDILIEDCHIEMTAGAGIFLHHRVWNRNSPMFGYNADIHIRNNILKNIGGPGIQPNHCKNVLVDKNVIDGSGAIVDSRQRGRGSGLWTWYTEDVLIQNNSFMNAWGVMDSCGVHVDIGNINNTIQYNLSYNNAGGFVEILGDSHNTIYRYNISINDGWRVRNVNGAKQNGHILWLGGWTGQDSPARGPFDSFIYNNTIYLAPNLEARLLIDDSAEGAYIANNIFYIDGTLYDSNPGSQAVDIKFNNNLYTKPLLETFPFDSNAIFANPKLVNPGSSEPEDYRLLSHSPAVDAGIFINGRGDRDFWQNPLSETPDIGAHELQ